jgi:hypothetical protein
MFSADLSFLPKYPGVLVFISNPSSKAAANCLAKLVELLSNSFSKSGLVLPFTKVLVAAKLCNRVCSRE